MSYHFSGVFIA